MWAVRAWWHALHICCTHEMVEPFHKLGVMPDQLSSHEAVIVLSFGEIIIPKVQLKLEQNQICELENT